MPCRWKKDNQKNTQGFTLLEVLLVLILLGGAGFILLVKIPVQVEERNLSLASTRLIQDIREARQSALGENVYYEVRFYPSNNTYRIYRKTELQRIQSLPKGITFANYPANIRFSADGNTGFLGSNPSGTVALTNGKAIHRVITALISGRVREEIQ
ncbi:MAG: prepilin-type N-terminal cleavage/methylation domain-containing protein [Desulfitobacterium sp.]|nr:prepilin-type N-terminal cleavage/methylation domain-containing protein [Desulfitobacterium sp.]